MSIADQFWSKPLNRAKQSNELSIYQLDIVAFNEALSALNQQSPVFVSLPRMDGRLSQFQVTKTQVMATELAYKYPNIKTYKIQHINDPSIRGRMELVDEHLTALIKTDDTQELLKPDNTGGSYQHYTVQQKGVVPSGTFSCGAQLNHPSSQLAMSLPENSQYRSAPNTLKKLRVAIATTVEYSQTFCGTTPAVLAEVVKAVNRINEIYESELAITLELVNNNEDIIFLSSDQYNNDDATQMLGVNDQIINSVIGSTNYDLGHVFSTGGGGLASIGGVCSNNVKASGITGISTPFNDPFWVDYVAHEMGHQLGAEHTFNGTTGSCAGINRVTDSAYEPGSGSTIMAYAGICGGENLQTNSDASFHFVSIEQIDTTLKNNPSCGTNVAYSSIHSGQSNIHQPIADAGADYHIPVKTPFMLTASASDKDGDTLYYQWDGADKGSSTNTGTFGTDDGSRPLFRSNLPQTNATRYFPALVKLLTGVEHKGEVLPTTSRSINFKLKVTDNKGGLATDDVILTSESTIGPFKVTSQQTAKKYLAGSSVTINWDVANSDSSPVNCSQVDIQLLNLKADYSRFSQQNLLSATTNDGSATVVLPNENSAVNRFLVKCSDNVFFAINQSDFSIENGFGTASNSDFSTGVDGGLPATSYTSTSLTCDVKQSEPIPEEAGGGRMDFELLILLSGLLLARRRFQNF